MPFMSFFNGFWVAAIVGMMLMMLAIGFVCGRRSTLRGPARFGMMKLEGGSSDESEESDVEDAALGKMVNEEEDVLVNVDAEM